MGEPNPVIRSRAKLQVQLKGELLVPKPQQRPHTTLASPRGVSCFSPKGGSDMRHTQLRCEPTCPLMSLLLGPVDTRREERETTNCQALSFRTPPEGHTLCESVGCQRPTWPRRSTNSSSPIGAVSLIPTSTRFRCFLRASAVRSDRARKHSPNRLDQQL